ncbi:unnamed protein product [Medioppia subpectinata]|uniref:Uncharacterized protein n=1 Tax=Medioppia subpectinata TaxID=1979941 RepID=A0A7R9PYS6_9ACAR|nr:unnamed protein product [Medioppia subpectinata]CAG2105429.1 unnamed protein product [Medioppia subpectinata]
MSQNRRTASSLLKKKTDSLAYHKPFKRTIGPIVHSKCPSYHPSTKFKDLLDNDIIESIGENSSQLKESDNETDDFDHLFDKFSEIKLKSSQMNETDRKQYAEDMTIAFWKAIGGDEEEIKGLDSSFN